MFMSFGKTLADSPSGILGQQIRITGIRTIKKGLVNLMRMHDNEQLGLKSEIRMVDKTAKNEDFQFNVMF